MLKCVLLLKIWDMVLVLLKTSVSWKQESLVDIQISQSLLSKFFEIHLSSQLQMLKNTKSMNLVPDALLLKPIKLWPIFTLLITLETHLMCQRRNIEEESQKGLANIPLMLLALGRKISYGIFLMQQLPTFLKDSLFVLGCLWWSETMMSQSCA